MNNLEYKRTVPVLLDVVTSNNTPCVPDSLKFDYTIDVYLQHISIKRKSYTVCVIVLWESVQQKLFYTAVSLFSYVYV